MARGITIIEKLLIGIACILIFAQLVMIVGRSRMVRPVETTFVYAPGLFGSPIVIGRYCSRYEAHTGEIVYGTRGADIFGEGGRISAVIFPEIIVRKPDTWFRSKITPRVARSLFMKKFGIFVRDNPASADTIFNYIFDPLRANIGQAADVAALKAVFDRHVACYGDSQIVLFGDSRGAASVFNFVAQYKPPVACCICEGIFDAMPHIFTHCWLWSWKGNFIEDLLHKTLKFCSNEYTDDGPFPIDFVEAFPRELPLLLVTSVVDRIVPIECTIRLYNALRSRGYSKVHLLILPQSRHDSYMVGPDRDMYEGAVHAFYREYGIITYNSVKADFGRQFFVETQPPCEQLKELYHLNKDCCVAF